LTFFQGIFVITFIPYVPVDWKSYMQQVDIHLKKNEFNYAELKGENGTANYPACFLYLYTLFYYITYEG
jgi:alpha-1,3-mannosyltransferase